MKYSIKGHHACALCKKRIKSCCNALKRKPSDDQIRQKPVSLELLKSIFRLPDETHLHLKTLKTVRYRTFQSSHVEDQVLKELEKLNISKAFDADVALTMIERPLAEIISGSVSQLLSFSSKGSVCLANGNRANVVVDMQDWTYMD